MWCLGAGEGIHRSTARGLPTILARLRQHYHGLDNLYKNFWSGSQLIIMVFVFYINPPDLIKINSRDQIFHIKPLLFCRWALFFLRLGLWAMGCHSPLPMSGTSCVCNWKPQYLLLIAQVFRSNHADLEKEVDSGHEMEVLVDVNYSVLIVKMHSCSFLRLEGPETMICICSLMYFNCQYFRPPGKTRRNHTYKYLLSYWFHSIHKWRILYPSKKGRCTLHTNMHMKLWT